MRMTIAAFYRDEAGFIVSAELVLIATIGVLSMVVGLSEIANSLNNELDDVACAFGSINQTFCVSGFEGCKAKVIGSFFRDTVDNCDCNTITCNNPPQPEGGNGGHGGW